MDDKPCYVFDDEKVCSCEHLPGEHGWERCDVAGCKCEAHWGREKE